MKSKQLITYNPRPISYETVFRNFAIQSVNEILGRVEARQRITDASIEMLKPFLKNIRSKMQFESVMKEIAIFFLAGRIKKPTDMIKKIEAIEMLDLGFYKKVA